MSAADTIRATPQADDTVWKERDPLIDRIPRPLAISGLVLGVIGLWWLMTGLKIVSPIILPSPAETGADLAFVGINLVSGGYVLSAFITTTLTVIYAFLMAIGIGFVLGTLVGETKFGERAVMPLLVAVDTMPKVAFAPLFIAWLGFGISSKVALATFILSLIHI